MSEEQREIPEEFNKIMKDFVSDVTNTFPEYQPIIDKWWKPKTFDDIPDEEARNLEIIKDAKDKMTSLFNHCISVYPERFFDILYQKPELFDKDSTLNTDFLPGISFRYLWQCDISDKTRETIWKYLQMVLICVVGSVNSKEAFGDTTKLFEAINEDEFKSKLEETLEGMQGIFDNLGKSSDENENENDNNNSERPGMNMPSAEDIHSHINGMIGGKLGDLAREIAEEQAQNLDIDLEGITDAKGVFQKLFQNPGKLMNMVKSVSDKLDSRMKSGELNKTDLMKEASEMMNKMKDMPGMPNIQEMLSKMGMGGANGGGMPDLNDLAGLAGLAGLGRNTKLNTNAMQQKLDRMTKQEAMKDRMRKKLEAKQLEKITSAAAASLNQAPTALSDEELITMFSTGEKVERTPRGANPTPDASGKKKKNKKNSDK
jgi:hypothetical protein